MKIKVYDKDLGEGRNFFRIEIDGKKGVTFEVHDGDPEDNILSRNFSDCWGVPSLLMAAFKRGQREGKTGKFEIEYVCILQGQEASE